MLLEAASDNDLNLNECVVIGDRWTDMLAADEAGCTKVLVKTGGGEEAFNKYKNQEYFGKWARVSPDFVAHNFLTAARWIMSKQS